MSEPYKFLLQVLVAGLIGMALLSVPVIVMRSFRRQGITLVGNDETIPEDISK